MCGLSSDERTFGETRIAHAGDRTETSSQIAVEGFNLRVFVSGLPSVQLEQQHILAIAAELDRVQIRKRPYKEPGCNQHHERDGDLPNQQHLAQADPPESMHHLR